jgi:hypothetical protein
MITLPWAEEINEILDSRQNNIHKLSDLLSVASDNRRISKDAVPRDRITKLGPPIIRSL